MQKNGFLYAFGKLVAAGAVISALMMTGPAQADDSLYRDLGERTGIAKIVEATTANFLSDERVRHTFDDTNIDRFKALFTDQLCVVAGGPCQYKGRDMRTAHKGLHLTNRDFNAVVEDLQTGMDSCGIPFRTQNRLLARLAPMQREVVTR
jgi:hemoglobin